jgi:hypothetical protein
MPVFPGRPGARRIETEADIEDVIVLMCLVRVVTNHGVPGEEAG